MGMRTTLVAASVTVLLLAGCASAGGSGGSTGSGGSGGQGAATDAASLIRERCTRCHAIDRIKSAQHDAAGWEGTIARMRGRGADLSDAEAATVAEYLAGGGGAKL